MIASSAIEETTINDKYLKSRFITKKTMWASMRVEIKMKDRLFYFRYSKFSRTQVFSLIRSVVEKVAKNDAYFLKRRNKINDNIFNWKYEVIKNMKISILCFCYHQTLTLFRKWFESYIRSNLCWRRLERRLFSNTFSTTSTSRMLRLSLNTLRIAMKWSTLWICLLHVEFEMSSWNLIER